MKTIAVHSIRGGTGKSVLSINLAYLLAEKGNNVVLIDYDMRAPSLYFSMKKPEVHAFLNDYLEGEVKPEDILRDMKRSLGTKGKISMIFSDPSIPAVKEMMTKTRKWEMEALKKIIRLIKYLKDQGYDWVIVDGPPGPQYSAINAMVSSDAVILVVTPDKVEIESCRFFVKEVYEGITAKKLLVVNKVPASSMDEAKTIGKSVAKSLENIKLLASVPYFPEVVLYNGEKIMARDFPHHPYSIVLKTMVDEMVTYLQSS